MRFRVEVRGADLALGSRELEASDRGAALAALEPAERLGLRSLAEAEGIASPARALAALALLLERGVPLGAGLSTQEAALDPAAREALARGESLSAVLAVEPSAPALLVEVLAGAEAQQPAAFVRLGATWLHRLETARREQVNRLLYPLCLLAVAFAVGGLVLSVRSGFQLALVPDARTPGFALGLGTLLGGGWWLRRRWGKPGPGSSASLGFRLQALALLVRAEVDLPRVWAGVWGAAEAPREGDPCAAIAYAAGLGRGEAACLVHAMGQGPGAFADELHALGEVRLAWAEAQLARQARLLRLLCYALAGSVALAAGLQRAAAMREAVS